jgi:hypothetical protein
MFRFSPTHEISIVLAFKIAALVSLYVLFFGPEARPDLTAETVSRSLLTDAAPIHGER